MADFAFDQANPRAVEWAEKHAAKLVSDVSKTTRKKIREIIASGIEDQDDPSDIASELYDLLGDENRAELVARTELMTAANKGLQEAWAQAVDAGLLDADAQQEWITTPDDRLCPICEPLDGATAPLDETFTVDGEEIDGPPAHPRCRCILGIAAPRKRRKAAGGHGSGNFGHAGRPGEVGGSSDLPHGTVVAKSKLGEVIVVRGHSEPGKWDHKGDTRYQGVRKNGEGVGTYKTIDSAKQALREPNEESRQFWPSGHLFPDVKWKTLGGKGSGNYGHAGRPGEVGGSSEGDRVARAIAAHNPYTKEKDEWATKSEQLVTAMTGGEPTDNNSPVDVIVKVGNRTFGIEVKTMLDNTNNKITVRADALSRKHEWAHSNHASLHTLVFDERAAFGKPELYSGNRIYYRKGVGSFRVETLIPVKDADHLRRLMKLDRARAAGGAGSGNFGHSGRPGAVGGSAVGQESGQVYDDPLIAQWVESTGEQAYHSLNDPSTDRGKAFLDAVNKLPDYKGTVYRGFLLPKDEFDAMIASGRYTPSLTVSTSKDERTAKDFVYPALGGEVSVFAEMDVRTGKDLKSGEDEVVVKPGTKFAVIEAPEERTATTDDTVYQHIKLRETATPKVLGGPGSGNFGHAGRPGEVGGSGPGGDTVDQRLEWPQLTDDAGRPIPIRARSVEEAISLVLAGKVVELEDVEQAHTLLSELGQIALAAEAAGQKAPKYDLCNVSVKGSNLFCGDKLRTPEFPNGIPRLEMPVIPGSEKEHFIQSLRVQGIKSTREEVPASWLRASQSELVGSKVAQLMLQTKFDPAASTIFVSRDNYVIDGHHRWAAVVGRDAADNRLGDLKMHVIRLDAPISEIYHRARAWQQERGIASRGTDQWAHQKGWVE